MTRARPGPDRGPRRRWLAATAGVAVALGAACGPGDPGPAAQDASTSAPAPDTGTVAAPAPVTGEATTVTRVVDGDTLVTAAGRVRLIGVDTPETVHPDRGVECFGREASAYLTRLVPPGTRVRLVFDAERRDRYDRLLAYVYRQDDGLFVNAELVAQGYAQVMTVPPNVAHADELVALAREAREAGRGLWRACPDAAGEAAGQAQPPA
ncbi:MAG: hypothetical protein KatS3mg009_2203 [Acidimicrobiia bacterium]|nr:MAG: hypothetical protein KatS3mg009_2203 [Acidimicrobiia bacterium]